MRYAIDRFKVGTEQEVHASEFYGMKYIPQRDNRFYCPECGERVFWRSRGGALPDTFCHYTRTAASPECDKRVDGRSGLSLYERVGLPLYLENSEGHFQLQMGFPAIGEAVLLQAGSAQLKVTIEAGQRKRDYSVNQTLFYSDSTTFLALDFIPPAGKNYSISISKPFDFRNIAKSWSDYADGFGIGGAIFTFGESGGKKIRRGDSVYPYKQYYVISNSSLPRIPGLIFSTIGRISLNGVPFSVYLLKIEASTSNETQFKRVDNYLKQYFGVSLLETAPELTPLWPPVSLQDGLIPVKSEGSVYCDVISGNDTPNVYYYVGSAVSAVPVTGRKGCFTAVLKVSSSILTVSVDRKYVGRELFFRKTDLLRSEYDFNLVLEDINKHPIPLTTLTPEAIASMSYLGSNAKFDLYIESSEKNYQHVAIRSPETPFKARKNPVGLLIVVENGILKSFYVQKPDKTNLVLPCKLLDGLARHDFGQRIPAPYWVENVIAIIRNNGYVRQANEIRTRICDGRISTGLLKYLFTIHGRLLKDVGSR